MWSHSPPATGAQGVHHTAKQHSPQQEAAGGAQGPQVRSDPGSLPQRRDDAALLSQDTLALPQDPATHCRRPPHLLRPRHGVTRHLRCVRFVYFHATQERERDISR